jgi:glucose dehydrogenase
MRFSWRAILGAAAAPGGWAAKLDRTANANPITYQGKNGKQYVAIVATDRLAVFALP